MRAFVALLQYWSSQMVPLFVLVRIYTTGIIFFIVTKTDT